MASSRYYVNRDTLFSYHKASEVFLQRLMALYVASHYKVVIAKLCVNSKDISLTRQGSLYGDGSRPWDKGGGGGGGLSRPWDNKGARSPKNFLWPFGPQFGLKVTGGRRGGPFGPLPFRARSTVSDKNSWDTLAKRCFFPSRAHHVPLKVVYRGSVTKSCTPTLRGQGDPEVSQPFWLRL